MCVCVRERDGKTAAESWEESRETASTRHGNTSTTGDALSFVDGKTRHTHGRRTSSPSKVSSSIIARSFALVFKQTIGRRRTFDIAKIEMLFSEPRCPAVPDRSTLSASAASLKRPRTAARRASQSRSDSYRARRRIPHRRPLPLLPVVLPPLLLLLLLPLLLLLLLRQLLICLFEDYSKPESPKPW